MIEKKGINVMIRMIVSGKIVYAQQRNAFGNDELGVFILECRQWDKDAGESIHQVVVTYPSFLNNTADRLVEKGKYVGVEAKRYQIDSTKSETGEVLGRLWVMADNIFIL